MAIRELDRGELPLEVVIDEAVRLAKRYASAEGAALVNGILGQDRARGCVTARRPRPAVRTTDAQRLPPAGCGRVGR